MNPQRPKLLPLTVSDKPAYAVHLRLTPELKEALLNAKTAGHSISVRLGNEFNKTALTVGHQEFLLTTTEEGSTDLIAVPPDNDANGTCAQVGVVKQKLHVQKTAGNIDRERIRASAEAAERRQRERRAVVVTPADMKGDAQRAGGATTTTTTTIKTTSRPAPARPSGTGLPPKPLSGGPANNRTARAPSPTPPPTTQPKALEIPKPGSLKAKAAAAQRQAKRTPPPPSQPRHTPPPSSSTDPPRRTPPPADPYQHRAAAAEDEEPAAAALTAAARGGDLRQCVLAALAARPLGRTAVLERVRAAYRAARAPTPEDSEVVDALRQAATRDPTTGLFTPRSGSAAATAQGPSTHGTAAHERPPRPAAAAAAHKRREPDPFADLDDSPPDRAPAPAPAPHPLKRLRPASAPTPAAVDPGPGPPSAPHDHRSRPTSPPSSTTSDSDSLEGRSPQSQGGADGGSPPAAVPPASWRPPQPTSNGHAHHHDHHHHNPPQHSGATTASRPPSASRQASPYHSVATNEGLPPASATPSTAASPQRPPAPVVPQVVPEVDPDEGEYVEWLGRDAEPAEAISSSAQLEAAQAQYQRRWGTYHRLHTRIEDFKNEVDALWKAAQAAGDERDRQRLEAAVKEAALRKGRMSNRWHAALQVLHQELASIRGAVEEYAARTGLIPIRAPSTS